MAGFSYRIDPIHASGERDSQLARMLDEAWTRVGMTAAPPMPPPLRGWRLLLLDDGRIFEQLEFGGSDHGFESAQRTGCAWLERHGADPVGQWLARIGESSRRMAWDYEYRLRIEGHAVRSH